MDLTKFLREFCALTDCPHTLENNRRYSEGRTVFGVLLRVRNASKDRTLIGTIRICNQCYSRIFDKQKGPHAEISIQS